MAKVVSLKERRPKQALERLNRLTGLDFRHWPESLLDAGDDRAPADSGAPRLKRG